MIPLSIIFDLHKNSTVINYTIIHVQKSTFQFQQEKNVVHPGL